MKNKTPEILGIGGIFFKSHNPQKTKEWYEKKLGIKMEPYGAMFAFRNIDNPDQINYLRWSVFDANTNYMKPSEKDFMINYIVRNLEDFIENLKKNGVTIVDEITEYSYGKFIHILDDDGNKIELWEPDNAI